jgi:hypothetical protein
MSGSIKVPNALATYIHRFCSQKRKVNKKKSPWINLSLQFVYISRVIAVLIPKWAWHIYVQSSGGCGWNSSKRRISISFYANEGTWNYKTLVQFDVFIGVTMKNVVFWGVALCRSWANRRFGWTYRLYWVEKSASREPASAGGCILSHQSETTSYIRTGREGV